MKNSQIREAFERDRDKFTLQQRLSTVSIIKAAIKMSVDEHRKAIEDLNDIEYKKNLTFDFIKGYKACSATVKSYHKDKIRDLMMEINECDVILEENKDILRQSS